MLIYYKKYQFLLVYQLSQILYVEGKKYIIWAHKLRDLLSGNQLN